MQRTPAGIYQSELFEDPGLIHGFSTKRFGDMQDKKDRKKFLTALGIDESSLVREEQVHGDSIHIVQLGDRGKIIKGVDGLIFRESNDITLSVHTADCVPLLFFDPMIRIIGSAHAGWRGTTLHIGKKIVGEMGKLGADIGNIRVAIGPGICGECYEIDKKRLEIFQKEFPDSNIVTEKNNRLYADIGKANYLDLVSIGVNPEHIDYDPALCTFCKNDEFYSFRKNGKKLEGEIMGVIGVKN